MHAMQLASKVRGRRNRTIASTSPILTRARRCIRLFLVLPVPFWKLDFGISVILSLVLHFLTFLMFFTPSPKTIV